MRVKLPAPWSAETFLDLDVPEGVVWLLGPNGTGKSRLLDRLRSQPELKQFKPRLITTDRLAGTRVGGIMRSYVGDPFAAGLHKTRLDTFVEANRTEGAMFGVVALLHNRPDLRIRVEATLSQLLDREILLEMSDGNLQPRVRHVQTATSYSMLVDECHGVQELLVLLTNIYDPETEMLLIDEPEQNLHPQYQAFVLDELLRSGKRAILATHSPSFLAVRSLADLRSVVCCHADFSEPSRYSATAQTDYEVAQILPRMTEQHRTFYFARVPVFVEGYFDGLVIGAIQRSLGVSAEAAGSCLIPSQGKNEASRYLMLCRALRKDAVFVFDLDALFDQRLSAGAQQDPAFAARVAGQGHGRYTDYLGQLQIRLAEAATAVQSAERATLPINLTQLANYLDGEGSLPKRRLAILIALELWRDDIDTVLGAAAVDVRGKRDAVLEHLRSVGIHVLPGGALENYAPSYSGSPFDIPDATKATVAMQEQAWLGEKRTPAEIRARYGGLIDVIERLPAKPAVDVTPTLRRELAHFLHHLVMGIRRGQIAQADQMSALGDTFERVKTFISVEGLSVRSTDDFDGELVISDLFGIGALRCRFDAQTLTSHPDGLRLVQID